jgi:hypothetical protein
MLIIDKNTRKPDIYAFVQDPSAAEQADHRCKHIEKSEVFDPGQSGDSLGLENLARAQILNQWVSTREIARKGRSMVRAVIGGEWNRFTFLWLCQNKSMAGAQPDFQAIASTT